MNEKVNIFVACHKPTYVLKNPLLIPIQVGTALAKTRIPDMVYDDEDDNISAKNTYYCELTAQYWAWKNVQSEYYGFFHYRRYLSFENVYAVDNDGDFFTKQKTCPYIEVDDIRDDLMKYHLEKEYMERTIAGFDLLTVLRERINTTVYRQYCQYHSKEALDRVIQILSEKYPEYLDSAKEYLNSKKIYYLNMFIMKKSLFMEYAEWLFDILGAYEREADFSEEGKIEDRLMGYLAERLFGIFYTYHRRSGAACAELSYLKFYNTEVTEKGEAKAKSIGNIRKFRLKPTKIEIKIDMKKLNKIFPAGTRRRILIRNIFLR